MIEVDCIERLKCMDEVDLECPHCQGLTAHRFCSGGDPKQVCTHCAHCGNPLIPNNCKQLRPQKRT